MVCYIYKKTILNIDDSTYIELSLNSIETESTMFSNYQFLTYAIIRTV